MPGFAREAFEGPKVNVKVRPGDVRREESGVAEADARSIVRLCELWAYRVTKERGALEAMPLNTAYTRLRAVRSEFRAALMRHRGAHDRA